MKTLTDNPTSFPAITVPEDGVDFESAASLEPAFQQLANRTRLLNDFKGALEDTGSDDDGASKIGACPGPGILVSGTVRSQLDALDQLTSIDGVKRIRAVAYDDLATLPANDGDVCMVGTIGLYFFVATTGGTPQFPMLLAGLDGLWVWVGTGLLGDPNGLPYLQGGKVPDAQLGRGAANGVASLGASGKVPDAQLGRGAASGVCDLDAGAKVPNARLHGFLARASGRALAGSSLTVYASQGCASITFNPASGPGRKVRVTLATPMANDLYSVAVQAHDALPLGHQLVVKSVDESTFDIMIYDNTNTLADMGTAGVNFSFIVTGA